MNKDLPAATAYIGIGSNLGDPLMNTRQAIACLMTLPRTRLVNQSTLFRTAPIDADGGDYINAVAEISTHLAAPELLQELQSIEAQFGRQRPYLNAPRTLDLDILLYADDVIDHPSLTIPHPRLISRAFVLVPLLQLAPEIIIPGHGPAHQFMVQVAHQSIQECLAE